MLYPLALVSSILHGLIARLSYVLSRFSGLTSKLCQIVSVEVRLLLKVVTHNETLGGRNVVSEVRLMVLPLKVVRIVLLHLLYELERALRDFSV